MNPAATIGVISAVLSFSAGVAALRLASAPGSSDQRWFAVVAFAAAGYSLCNLATTLPLSPLAVTWLSRVQIGTTFVNLWGWLRFSRGYVLGPIGKVERRGSWALLALSLLPLVPGAVVGPEVVDRPYPPLGVVYRQAITTPSGDVLFAVLLVAAFALAVRFLRAARRGVPHGWTVAIAFTVLLALAGCDALATALVAPLPFVLDGAFAVPLLAVAWIGTSRFIDSARKLEDLGAHLWRQVEERTRELAQAQETLLQTEKLASLGHFANGVAHEVNNPAAVVTSSLRFVAHSAAAPGGTPLDPESAAALADAEAAMQRIIALVRKLVDAGRVAIAPTRTSIAELGEAIAQVARRQAPAVRARLAIEGDPGPLHVPLRPEGLEHVLEILVSNAADALPEGSAGRIAIRAERRDGAVRVTVSDDGAGMTPDVLRRAFDPFFTTKPLGAGSGLGLPVARGLVESAGGTLRLESAPGAGTDAVLELPEEPVPRPEPSTTRA